MDNATISRTTSFLGMSGSLFLSGVFFSASHLTLPILYRFPVDVSTSIFSELYYRGAKTAAPLAVGASVSYAVAAYLDPARRKLYATAALIVLSPLIWTVAVMMSVNYRLIDIDNDRALREKVQHAEVEQLLRRWKWMNMVRSGLAGMAGVLGLLVITGNI